MRLLTALSLFLVIVSFGFLTGCAEEISADKLGEKIGQPHESQFFDDHAVYMGDKDGYRYVRVRDVQSCFEIAQDRDYKVPESQWPMKHPMPLTDDSSQWQNVQWLNGDAPDGVPQNGFLKITPTFLLGAPATQPAHPATSQKSQ